ncbi:MAG: hypothetical protein ABSH01_19960 [Terriglobia bacterium]
MGEESAVGLVQDRTTDSSSSGKAGLLLRDLIRRKDNAELHNLFGEVDEALGDPTSMEGVRLQSAPEVVFQ